MKHLKLSISGLLFALAAGGLSSCSTDTHEVRREHYVHYVPRDREYYSDRSYYGEPYYRSTPAYGESREYRSEPADFDVVNQYDRQAR
jgi:hypothetical protein